MDGLMGELGQSYKDRCIQKQRRHSLEKPLGALCENVRDLELEWGNLLFTNFDELCNYTKSSPIKSPGVFTLIMCFLSFKHPVLLCDRLSCRRNDESSIIKGRE